VGKAAIGKHDREHIYARLSAHSATEARGLPMGLASHGVTTAREFIEREVPAALLDLHRYSTPSSRHCSSHRASAWLGMRERRTPSSETA